MPGPFAASSEDCIDGCTAHATPGGSHVDVPDEYSGANSTTSAAAAASPSAASCQIRAARSLTLTAPTLRRRNPQLESPEYECRPWKNTFTTPKLNITAENPMIASHADREPRQPRVARAWMYPA